MFLHYGDLSDSTNLFHIISEIRPHEVYNLGAMSHVAVRIIILLYYNNFNFIYYNFNFIYYYNNILLGFF